MLVLLLLLGLQSAPAAIVFGGKAELSCGCQCSEIGFRATDGSLQGNCLRYAGTLSPLRSLVLSFAKLSPSSSSIKLD